MVFLRFSFEFSSFFCVLAPQDGRPSGGSDVDRGHCWHDGAFGSNHVRCLLVLHPSEEGGAFQVSNEVSNCCDIVLLFPRKTLKPFSFALSTARLWSRRRLMMEASWAKWRRPESRWSYFTDRRRARPRNSLTVFPKKLIAMVSRPWFATRKNVTWSVSKYPSRARIFISSFWTPNYW